VPFVDSALSEYNIPVAVVQLICSYDDISHAMILTLMVPVTHQPDRRLGYYYGPRDEKTKETERIAMSDKWKPFQGALPINGIYAPVLMTSSGLIFEVFEEVSIKLSL
jgi:hypothetical protein